MLGTQREIRLPLAHHNRVNCGLLQTYNRNRENEFLFLGPVCVVQLNMLKNVKGPLFCVLLYESSRSVYLLLYKLKLNANVKEHIYKKMAV